ncbi:unnamed protein product [Rotaria sp. Silwood1]|nr:unnamed protein product [Rotaria sp. Silwood1]
MITLEHIANERDEESPSASDLLSILQDQSTTFILHSLEPILEALSILSKSMQTKNDDFNQLEQFMFGTLLRLEELKDTLSSNYFNLDRITRSTIRTNEINLEELFKDKIVKFINNIISNIKARFQSNVLKFLNCFRIFDMSEVTNEEEYATEIFLCAPISTATVERDFSTMNRILTDLRNRLTTEHLN